MRIITIQDEESAQKYLARPLELSLLKHGIQLTVLPIYDRSLKNLSKIVKWNEYLSAQPVESDNDIIVFCDAHDVLFAPQDIQESLSEFFIKSGLDYLVSSEQFSAHHLPNVEEWFTDNYGNHHLNSGVQIGYQRAFKAIFGYITDNLQHYNHVYKTSDQRILSQFFKDQMTSEVIPNLKIDLDHTERLSLTMNSKVPFTCSWNSFFIHITWLTNSAQREKHQKLLRLLNLDSAYNPCRSTRYIKVRVLPQQRLKIS